MECPHCKAKLTLKEAIEILNGCGFVQMAKIRTPEGAIVLIEAGLVNPHVVEIIED